VSAKGQEKVILIRQKNYGQVKGGGAVAQPPPPKYAAANHISSIFYSSVVHTHFAQNMILMILFTPKSLKIIKI
jgi:hypothetical protein